MWDPTTYLRYDAERSRPFDELLARVAAEHPSAVADLGCGPGNLTVTLADRWPAARISGLDSSTEMIEEAVRLGSTVDFRVGDLRDFTPTPDVDVLVSNAALQWVPDHETLLARWARELAPASWIAVQLPNNFDAASHRALRQLAAEPHWHRVVAPVLRADPVRSLGDYVDLMVGVGCVVDAWETTYVHLLPAPELAAPDAAAPDAADQGVADPASASPTPASGLGEHPVLTWLDGTALRPVHAALGGPGPEWDRFRAELGDRLAEAYPVRDGWVQFPYRRVFFVARTRT